jgi:predicted tellurium resistance membrane protein TerC
MHVQRNMDTISDFLPFSDVHTKHSIYWGHTFVVVTVVVFVHSFTLIIECYYYKWRYFAIFLLKICFMSVRYFC